MSLKKFSLLNDIYYLDEYISIYLKEGEELFDFIYREENLFFINKAIKRAITQIGNRVIDDGYYDLETVYGYGGFYTNTDNESFVQRAFEAYYKRCQDENIIAEFIRFHPFNDFPVRYKNYLEFNVYDRDVVVVSLEKDIMHSYSSKVRNIIKRVDEKVTVKKSNNLKKFIELYSETMKKNSASDFYFFNENLFKNLYRIKNIELYEVVFKDEVIAMGFFLNGSAFMHYHLSANSALSYRLNANYALLYNLSEIAKKEGKYYFILGGGTSSLDDDPLLKFKKKFSKEIKPFYISGKIYNHEIYNRYIRFWEEQSRENQKYFLKYRLEIL